MEDRKYKSARRQVKKKKGFYVHLAVYLSVGAFFLLLNLLTFEGDWWFFFPLLPWGIGLGIHYLTVFGFPGTDILTEEWEKRELDKELYRRGYQPRKELPPESSSFSDELDLSEPRSVKERKPNWEEDDIV